MGGRDRDISNDRQWCTLAQLLWQPRAEKCIECISLVLLIWFHTMRTSIAINHIRQRVYVRCANSTMCVCWECGTHFSLLGFFHIFIPFYFLFFVFISSSFYCSSKILIDVVVVVVLFPSVQCLFEFLLILYSHAQRIYFLPVRCCYFKFQLLFICMISPKVILDIKTSVSTFRYPNATQSYISSLHLLINDKFEKMFFF